MSTLKTTNIQNASSATTNIALDTSGNVTVGNNVTVGGGITASSGTVVMSSPFTMRNKIINGAMVIDQRNAGASVTPTNGQYLVDRWRFQASQTSKFTCQQNQGSVTPPSGFKNYLGFTSSSAYSVVAGDYFGVNQFVEGYNTADLDWGTSNAKSVTLSFYVRSSLTGTFGGAIRTGDGSNYSYPFTYAISSANTWTYCTVSISGPTAGTWGSTTSAGLDVWFSLGTGSTFSGTANTWAAANYVNATGSVNVVGTNGATFYITGVQLERGTVATPFEYRNYQQELAMCQRYYCKTFDQGTAPANNTVTAGALRGTARLINAASAIEPAVSWRFPVSMRAAPSITLYSAATSGSTAGQWTNDGNGTYGANARASFIGTDGVSIDNTGVILGANQPWIIHAAASIEL